MKAFVLTLMKRTTAALLVLGALQANAQNITKPVKLPADLYVGGDYTKGTSTNTGSTLFCAENTGFTLKADLNDPVTGAAYTGYTWEEQQTASTSFGTVANGTATNEKLVISSATPGWHTYKVTATLAGNACPPEPNYFTVYVLPKLKVTAESNKPDAASHTFCADAGAPADPATQIKFTGNVVFDGTPNSLPGLENLTPADFELTYTWTKNDGTNTTTAGNTKDYTVADAATTGASTTAHYTYELTAAYAVKACGTYKGTATLNGSTTTATVTVTPKPGKPAITIQ